MRIAVTYNVQRLPVAYRMHVLSLIKEALSCADESYFRWLYKDRRHAMKPFGSAIYLKDFTYIRDEIHLKELTITIGSHDMEFMLHLFNGLQQLHKYKIRGETWIRTNIKMLKETTITSRKIVLRTLSPVLIESKEGRPLHPEEEGYKEAFQYYASLRIRELCEREPYEPIGVEPLRLMKTVIKEKNFSLPSESVGKSKPYLYFTAYRGILRLTGHPDDLQLLYLSGVGQRVSQSFGLLEFEREEM